MLPKEHMLPEEHMLFMRVRRRVGRWEQHTRVVRIGVERKSERGDCTTEENMTMGELHMLANRIGVECRECMPY
jgi:hypothetical protein